MYLLDTQVVAELRKARSGNTDRGLITWASAIPRHSMHLSVLSVLELQNGVAAANAGAKAAASAMETWIAHQLLPAFEGRLLPLDLAVCRRRAGIALPDPRAALIAATALEHGLTLVTRDVAAYRTARLRTFNPWGYAPADDETDWRQASRARPQWFKNLFLRA